MYTNNSAQDEVDAIFGTGRVSHYEDVGECMFCGRKAQKVVTSYDEDERRHLGTACIDVDDCGFHFRARTEG